MTTLYTLVVTTMLAVSGPNYQLDVQKTPNLTAAQCQAKKTAAYDTAVKDQKNVIATCRQQ